MRRRRSRWSASSPSRERQATPHRARASPRGSARRRRTTEPVALAVRSICDTPRFSSGRHSSRRRTPPSPTLATGAIRGTPASDARIPARSSRRHPRSPSQVCTISERHGSRRDGSDLRLAPGGRDGPPPDRPEHFRRGRRPAQPSRGPTSAGSRGRGQSRHGALASIWRRLARVLRVGAPQRSAYNCLIF